MRRSFFIFLLCVLIGLGIARYTQLTRLAENPQRTSEHFTPADGPKVDVKDMQVLSALDAEYTRLIDAVVPSVVSITSSRTVRLQQRRVADPLEMLFPGRRNRMPVEQQQSSLGSGVIVSREGHILTNNHVIADMEKIEVQLTDGRVLPAQLIGSDEETDIAVLKVDAKNIEPLPFGDSDQVRVGQLVFAIGNPFGLQESVTQGIISAKGRRAVADSGVEFLQTDAAVNRGNSGGPLLNLRGEIVGINSAIYSNSESGNWLGISFAIPANTARHTLESLLKTGRVVRGYLGVQMTNLTPAAARQLGLPDLAGAAVMDIVPGSPAERGGLKPGDVIRSFDGRQIADIVDLRSRIAEVDVNANVKLGVWREGALTTVPIVIAEAPADLSMARAQQQQQRPRSPSTPPPASNGPRHPLADVQVSEIPADVQSMLTPNIAGVLVTGVRRDSPAADKLRVGDVIEEVNQRAVPNAAAFQAAIEQLQPRDRVLLFVSRGHTRAFIVVP